MGCEFRADIDMSTMLFGLLATLANANSMVKPFLLKIVIEGMPPVNSNN